MWAPMSIKGNSVVSIDDPFRKILKLDLCPLKLSLNKRNKSVLFKLLYVIGDSPSRQSRQFSYLLEALIKPVWMIRIESAIKGDQTGKDVPCLSSIFVVKMGGESAVS